MRSRHRHALRRPRLIGVASLGLILGILPIAAAGASDRSIVRATPHGVAAAPPNSDWPTFHGDAGLSGVSPDPTISDANASQLGVAWMTHTFGAVLSSPVTRFSAGLGETLAYVANESGAVEAINTSNGAIVWGDSFGVPLHATPSTFGTDLWFGTAVSGTMIKVNADTGAVECRVSLGTGVDYASPVIATPPGGVPTVYVGVQDNGVVTGPTMAITESTCAVQWKRAPFPIVGGSWSPDSFAVNARGVPLVIFGSGDPDVSVYALNAVTGATVWRVTSIVGGPNDFGAGTVVSAPGVNGFADGMAYVPGKDRILYAIDLTTGKLVWTFDYGAATGTRYGGGRSTAALVGSTLVFGTTVGVAAVNAVTGHPLWLSENVGPTDTEVLSSPLITGPAGHQVVVFGDLNGDIRVLRLADGLPLYSFRTGGYVISSAADSAGNLLIGSSDGFLYDLALGGSNGTPPTTSISYPVNGSSIPNPDTKSALVPVVGSGSAADPLGVAAVQIAVQLDGAAGPWWNAASQSWQPGPADNPAALGSPGAASTSWSLGATVPREGGLLTFVARAVGADGLADPHLITSTVTVAPSTAGPHLVLSSPTAAPGISVSATGGGFKPGEPVQLSLPGHLLATATASASGSIPSTRIQVPAPSFPFGPTLVTALGSVSGIAATAPLDVTSPWSQFGHDPARTDYQPNDNVLSQEVTPGNKYRLLPFWSYSSGAPIRSSPAVAGGIAYVGNDAGNVIAVDVATGARVWSTPTGGPVDSSPALDAASKLLVVGSTDHKVYAVNQATGAVVWTATTGGAVESSPAVSNGTIYVGSDDHLLYAIAEATGAVRWTVPLGGAVRSSPSFDAASGTLIVGDDTGTVTAVHAGVTAATALWRFTTGGAITNSPLIAAGVVYLGSTDGVVRALTENTGAVRWAHALGHTSVTGGMAFQNGALFVGAADHTLTALTAASGSVQWSNVLSGPVTGVSVTGGMLFTESSNGGVTGLRIKGDVVWLASTGAGLAGTPVIVDNAVFVGAQDQGLYCYTPYGQPFS